MASLAQLPSASKMRVVSLGSLPGIRKNIRPSQIKPLSTRPSRTKRIYSLSGLSYGLESPQTTVSFIGQIASSCLWAFAAYLGYKLKLEQDEINRNQDKRACETCGGTGYVDCIICRRWSDAGDDSSGCNSCHATGKTQCHSCRGGGTAVPIEAKVYIKRERDYY